MQISFEREHRVTIDGSGVQKPTVLVVLVITNIVDECEVLSDFAKLLGKSAQCVSHGLPVDIVHDFVPIEDRIHVAQRAIKERLEIVVIPTAGDGVDNLVEVEIGETGGSFAGFAVDRRFRSWKQDAVKE